MLEAQEPRLASVTETVTVSLVRLHKAHFGRGPAHSRSYWAGPDALLCVFRSLLLPIERELVRYGQGARAREWRATGHEIIKDEVNATVEAVVGRSVIASAAVLDADGDILFQNFLLATDPLTIDG